MTHRILFALLPALLLTACTDVRSRLSPDTLAVTVHRDGTASVSARCTGQEISVSAEAESPLTLCAALSAASGKEIDAGHISLLCLAGSPAACLPSLLEMQALMPTTEVLWCREMPARLPDLQQLRAAVSEGLLPARTADCILGDLQCGSGVSALPTRECGMLTLALCDENGVCGILPPEAARGLALLGKRWKDFSFGCEEGACEILHTHFRISASETAGRLRFSLRGTAICSPKGIPQENWQPEAAAAITEMLVSACNIPAHTAGADLLLLRETAVRGGIAWAAACTQADWRRALRDAEFDVQIEVCGEFRRSA